MTSLNNLPVELLTLIMQSTEYWDEKTRFNLGRTCKNLFKLYQQDHRKHYIFAYLDQLTVEELQDTLQNHALFQKTYDELSAIHQKETTELNKTTELINAASQKIVATLILALDSMFKDCLQANIMALTEDNQKKAQALIKSDANNLAPAFCVSTGPVLWHAIRDGRYHFTDEDLFPIFQRSFLVKANSEDHNKINFLTQSHWGKKRVLSTIGKNKLLLRYLIDDEAPESNKQFILKDKDYRSVILSLPHAGNFLLCEIVTYSQSLNVLFFILQDKEYLHKVEASDVYFEFSTITEIIQIHKPNASSVCYLLTHPIVQRWITQDIDILLLADLRNILKACPYKEVIRLLLTENIYHHVMFPGLQKPACRGISEELQFILSCYDSIQKTVHNNQLFFSKEEQETITQLNPAYAAEWIQKFLPIAPLSVDTTKQAQSQRFAFQV